MFVDTLTVVLALYFRFVDNEKKLSPDFKLWFADHFSHKRLQDELTQR